MNRLLEHHYSDEDSLIDRILIKVHKAIDAHVPGAGEASNQFKKLNLVKLPGSRLLS